MRRPALPARALCAGVLLVTLLAVATPAFGQGDTGAQDDAAAAKQAAAEARATAESARADAEDARAAAMEARTLASDAHNTVNQSRIQLARMTADYEAGQAADRAVLIAILAAGGIAFGLAAFRLRH